MVHHMRSPEPIDIMGSSMKPVIRKIISKKQEQPIPPSGGIQIKDPVLVQKAEQAKDHCLGNKAHQNIPDPNPKLLQVSLVSYKSLFSL